MGMRAEQLELDYKKDKLAIRERDYKDVTAQLKVEGDAPRQNQLKAQLKDLREQIEQLEKEIEILNNKIKFLNDKLQQEETEAHRRALRHILQAHESQFLDMLTAYQWMLTNLKFSSLIWEPKTSQQIVTELNRIPKGSSRHNTIEKFVALLVSRLQDNDLLISLQDWGDQYVEDWPKVIKWVESYQKQQVQNAQPVVLVAVSRSDEASTQEQEGKRYQVKAWLIQDMDRYKKDRQGYSPIKLPDSTEKETYLLEELVAKTPQLLILFLRAGSDMFTNAPEIHIFLPLELMSLDVDCWKLDYGYGPKMPLGHEYKVVLRCADRVSRNYQHGYRWKEKWKDHKLLLREKAFGCFVAGDGSDSVDLTYTLEDVGKTVVGLKVKQAPSQDEQLGIFGALLQSGLPLAIWGRCNLREATNADELDRVLKAECLNLLPETVKKERRDSRKKAKDCHIGHHLSLLWDDPDLVPPKSA